jgi:hypothetical protein
LLRGQGIDAVLVLYSEVNKRFLKDVKRKFKILQMGFTVPLDALLKTLANHIVKVVTL